MNNLIKASRANTPREENLAESFDLSNENNRLRQ